ncbi:hypothetical protein LY76DRAFT_676975 [Colletotrichum caudatum]|nr:hypothetical protein LY76DRAFT_676975 [Colletotrichum caudatum]
MQKARPSRLQGFPLPEFDWDHEGFSREDENTSWVEQNHTDSETPLDAFLGILDPSPRSTYEKPVISSICNNEALETLRDDIESVPCALAAWLDERSRLEGEREGSGPVTARGLYERLKRKLSARPRDLGCGRFDMDCVSHLCTYFQRCTLETSHVP